MSEEQEQKRGWGFWVAVVILLVFIVYPASYAPLKWLALSGHLDDPETFEGVLNVFYAPIGWAMDNVPAVNRVMHWYFKDVWNLF